MSINPARLYKDRLAAAAAGRALDAAAAAGRQARVRTRGTEVRAVMDLSGWRSNPKLRLLLPWHPLVQWRKLSSRHRLR